MISLQKTNFVTFKKPNLRKPTKTYAKYTKYDDVKKDEEDVLTVFKDPESIEKINGRVAQVGWSLALYYELTKQESIWNQVFDTRTFTLNDGVSDTVTYPSAGFFIIPLLSILILSASLAPKVNGGDESQEYGPFTKRAELINGRGAMIGLLALSIVEHFNGGIALF
jgi:hypothetical protein